MRICHIISGDLWAGAEVMNYRLMQGLKIFKDIELSAIVLNEGELSEGLRSLQIPITVVDEKRQNFIQIVRNIRKIVMQTSPDIIHSHRLKENILAYFSAKSNKDIHLVCTQHGLPEPLVLNLKIIYNILLSRYHYFILENYFKHVIVVSGDMRKIYLEKTCIKSDKVYLIHNGTEIPNLNIKNKDGNIFVIGSAGRLFPVKDYPLMVEIAREVLHRTDKIKFELAGDGPEKEKIISLIRKYKIENGFTLTGFIDDMTTFYQGLDLYINTSLHEGLPMSILEAMAHGLPVVAPNTGGIVEILKNEVEGYLVDGRNPKTFAEKCIQLCIESELSRAMGNASKEKIINNFSMEKMANNYHDLYRKILK